MENYMRISSRDNSKIKRACALYSRAKERHSSGLFVLEGKKLCEEALIEELRLEEVFFTEKFAQAEQDFIKVLANCAKCAIMVSDTLLQKISSQPTPQGIMAICALGEKQLLANNTPVEQKGRYLLSEHLADPGNVGTVLRTAAALGIDGVFLCDNCADYLSPKVLRSTMGAAFKIPVYTQYTSAAAIKLLQKQGVRVYAAALGENCSTLGRATLGCGSAIAIGNEGNGLLPQTIQLCNGTLKIPMHRGVESLNAAAAATLLMWEMMRGE